ncbi:hen1 methyltransferase isoform X2 [Lycorma delicatula]|uniref:hen1 methyltransferase isoform X2 n=1 Tax=Lycorma delicatula TaxID=130591 RepID=UPI003F513023
MSSCFPSIQSFCHQNFCSLILIISCTIQIVFSLNMIILIHVLYICGEYLWSFFVNRNQVLPEPNQSNTDSAEECDVDVSYSLKHTKRFLNCPASEHSPVVNDSSQSNNLKNDFESYGEFEKALYDFDTKKIRFCPPVYIQRYLTVSNILRHERWNGQIKKVIDIGCSELGFFKFLKDIDGIEKIIEIDIDKKVLQEYSYRLHPFLSDYFNERKFPLEATILCGSVTHLDHRLEGADAVVAIELIEHLYPCDLEALPFNIFGVIKPRVAIFTTPNEDFNVLFDNFTGFRHDDHKFEWSRKQFESWAENICKRFPDYEVDFVGIGPGPNGKESLGCCSQAAVFVKIHYELPGELDHCKTYCEFVEFEVIEHIEYPFNSNTRSNDDITRDDAVNFMRSAARCGDYYNGERTEIPLANVLLRVYKTCDSSEKLRKILQESNYEVTTDKEGEYIVIVPDESVSSSEDVNEQFLTESLNESEQYIAHEVDHEVVSDDWDNVTRSDTPWDLSEIEPDEHKICNFIPDEASKEIVTTNLDHNSIEVMKNEITDNNSEKGDVDYFLNVNKADNAIECVVTDTACILEKNNDLDANKEHPLHKKHSELSHHCLNSNSKNNDLCTKMINSSINHYET